MNLFQKWRDAKIKTDEARAENITELRKQYYEADLRREHARISGLMQIKAQSLLPELVKVYTRDLQTGARTLNDLAQMALDSVEYLKSKADNKEVFEQMLANEWGEGHPPIWVGEGKPVELPLGTLEKIYEEQAR